MATANTKPVNSLSPWLIGLCAIVIMGVGTMFAFIIRDIVADPVSATQPAAVAVTITPPKLPATTPPDSVAVATLPDAPEPPEPPTAPVNEAAAPQPEPEQPAEVVVLPPPAAPVIEPEEELELPEVEPVAPAFLVPQTDYFSLFRETLTTVLNNYYNGPGAAYQFVEIEGPEGTFTVCFSMYGYWNGSSGNKLQWSDELRDRGRVFVTLLTPGGNPVQVGWCGREAKGEPPLSEIRFNQNQTLFNLFRNYWVYDPAFDKLKELSLTLENIGGDQGSFNNGPEVKVGNYYLHFCREVNFDQEKWNDFPPGSISGMWGMFQGIHTLNPDTLHITRYRYQGPETGFLKKATPVGEELTLVFSYNATRDLKVMFSPDTGFSEAEPVKAKN